MTRQRIAQLARKEQGLCECCNRHRNPDSRAYCTYHLFRKRSQKRKAKGFTPQYVSGMGRPRISAPRPDTQLKSAA